MLSMSACSGPPTDLGNRAICFWDCSRAFASALVLTVSIALTCTLRASAACFIFANTSAGKSPVNALTSTLATALVPLTNLPGK